MAKSPEAFRTISEVAEHLDIQTHVLRFWETKFSQIKPVKRAGGRRYYRPADVDLLSGIKKLLHDDGITIRGVQKILRERGAAHVAGLSGADAPHAEVGALRVATKDLAPELPLGLAPHSSPHLEHSAPAADLPEGGFGPAAPVGVPPAAGLAWLAEKLRARSRELDPESIGPLVSRLRDLRTRLSDERA